MAPAKPVINVKRITCVTNELEAQINLLLDEDTPWDHEQGQKFITCPDNALFVAFIEETPAGFLTAYKLQRLDNKKAEILLYEVGVQEEFQRQGIGTKLILAVKDWAKEVAAEELWVLTYASNAAAMALYKSVGGAEDPPGTRMFTFKGNE